MASDDIQLCALAQTAMTAGSKDIIIERDSITGNDVAVMSDGPIGDDLRPSSSEPSVDDGGGEDEASSSAKVEEDIPGLSSAARQLRALTKTFPLDKGQMKKMVRHARCHLCRIIRFIVSTLYMLGIIGPSFFAARCSACRVQTCHPLEMLL